LLQQAIDESNNFILIDRCHAGTFPPARELAWNVFVPPTRHALEGTAESNDVRFAVMLRSDHAIGRAEKSHRWHVERACGMQKG